MRGKQPSRRTGARTAGRAVCAGLLFCRIAGMGQGGTVEIESFARSGVLTWRHAATNTAAYRIERTLSLPEGLWSDVFPTQAGLAPTNSILSAALPLEDKPGGEAFLCYRVVALGPEPHGMAYIPSGYFLMGDSNQEGYAHEQPVREVYVSAFYMDRHPVTKSLWEDVYHWATNRSYHFIRDGAGQAANHPVHSLTWYDMAAWCNARSEKEGLLPAYYTGPDHHEETVYRGGVLDLRSAWVRWDAGYRLPTEAEWEKAARGGTAGGRFPWGDAIDHDTANYRAHDPPYSYDHSGCEEPSHHPEFSGSSQPYTNPVDRFAPNGYGLYDMAGNLRERVWDRYQEHYYLSAPAVDPRGPDAGFSRITRGGAWSDDARANRVAHRNSSDPQMIILGLEGFRTVRAR